MSELKKHRLNTYETFSGALYTNLDVSYQIYGQKLHSAPVVLVNHALTGNSDLISEEKGWWKDIVGVEKLIDLNRYTVIAFNILGNGYDNVFIDHYKDFIAKDIAKIFKLTMNEMGVSKLYATIGGSLGGGIAWEMAALYPSFIEHLIPIASDWKSSDWIIGHNSIQESILRNSKEPLQDARKMAMLFYRTPTSFKNKFNRTKTENGKNFNVVSWLNYHGRQLENRFHLKAYLMMNHLLSTIDITNNIPENITDSFKKIEAKITQISVDSDLFFVKEEALRTKELLDELNIDNEYFEIKSESGHDAFLIEHDQITSFLGPIFA